MIEALMALWLTGMIPVLAIEAAEQPDLTFHERMFAYWLWPLWMWFMNRYHWGLMTGWGDDW